jgi:inosine/xanthosine triphosphatase
MPLQKVIIASKNPVKINAVQLGFEKVFPDQKFEFLGVSVPSGVPDQPLSNEETLRGAINRVNNAQTEITDANYYVGLEGGLEKISKTEMEAFAWIVIKSKDKLEKLELVLSFYLKKL